MVWVLPHFCASSLGRPCRGGSSGKRSQPETKRISWRCGCEFAHHHCIQIVGQVHQLSSWRHMAEVQGAQPVEAPGCFFGPGFFGIDVCYARPPQRCWAPRPRYGTCARVLQDMWPGAPGAVCLGSRVGMAGYATSRQQNVEND